MQCAVYTPFDLTFLIVIVKFSFSAFLFLYLLTINIFFLSPSHCVVFSSDQPLLTEINEQTTHMTEPNFKVDTFVGRREKKNLYF